MDKHDFDSSGLSNHAFVGAMKQNFGPPRKQPESGYIYTAQAPDDRHDRDVEKESLFAIFMICIAMPVLAAVAVVLYLHRSLF